MAAGGRFLSLKVLGTGKALCERLSSSAKHFISIL